MPAVGSSNMKTRGSSAIRIATSSLRWSPCGSAARAHVALVGERDALEEVLGLLDQLAWRFHTEQQVLPQAGARLHREPHVLEHA